MPKKEEKHPIKRGRKKLDEKDAGDTLADEQSEQITDEHLVIKCRNRLSRPSAESAASDNTMAPIKPSYPQRREQSFNIEFDGVILSEGVLEMMPDGYGFLRSSDYNYLIFSR